MTEFNSKIKKNSRILKIFMFSICALFACAISSHAQSLVKGTVTDGIGEPLPGVSVVVKGTTNGTITDVNGKYSIQATAKDILSFSYVGMSDQEIKVAGQTTINVVMKDDVAALDEVIVVGYGTAKKQSLTGAVSAVKGDELLKAPATNVSSLLGGRLPGISSVQVSGEPGDDQATLRVRGSIYNVTYIVDGMPRSINDIDPNDIESVSVLKDGSDKMRYFASVGYLGQKGNIDNFSYKRYNLRTNLETQLAKNFQLSLGIAGNVGKRETPGYASGGTDSNSELGEQGWLSVAHQTIMMHPYLPETYDGLYTATTQNNTSLPNSPLAAIYESGYKHTNSFDLQTNISLQYNVPWVKGLSVKVTGAYDYTTSHNKNLNTPYSTYIHKMPTSTAGRLSNLGIQ